MSSLHDGFSSAQLEPVAAPFRGFRAFLIDDPKGPGHQIPLRTFRSSRGLDSNGRVLRGSLRGVFKTRYVWGPGANDAECLRGGFRAASGHSGVIDQACMCGFWAYTTGEHYLSVAGPAALGIVEGWGHVVVGPHGFRAQHARIVALTFPKPGDDTSADQASVKVNAGLLEGLVSAFTDLAGTLVDRLLTPRPAAATVSRVTATRIGRAAHPWERVSRDLKAAVVELYPDVQIFDSVAEMQAAFPLTDTRPLLDAPGVDGAGRA